MTSKLNMLSFVGLLGLLTLLGSGGLIWLGMVLNDMLQQFQILQEAREQGAIKDRIQEKLQRQNEIKIAVIRNLLDGRTTLLQTASAFRSINEQSPVPRPPMMEFPGATPEERVCREVIRWVETNLDGRDPDLVKRLEEELECRLSEPGGLQLPKVNVRALLE
jgi:hypothetical protein